LYVYVSRGTVPDIVLPSVEMRENFLFTNRFMIESIPVVAITEDCTIKNEIIPIN